MSSVMYKILSKFTSRFKNCTHLRPPFWSERRHLQYHHFHTNFHPNPPISLKVIRGFLCTHFRGLNVRNFGIFEATGLKNGIHVTFSDIDAYQFSWKPTEQFKSYYGVIQADMLVILGACFSICTNESKLTRIVKVMYGVVKYVHMTHIRDHYLVILHSAMNIYVRPT
jgi:hypothetical protein